MNISTETLTNFFSRALHAGLLIGSAYVAANPKYAWLIPIFTGMGSVTPLK